MLWSNSLALRTYGPTDFWSILTGVPLDHRTTRYCVPIIACHTARNHLSRASGRLDRKVATRLRNHFMLIGYACVLKIDQQNIRAQVKAALKEKQAVDAASRNMLPPVDGRDQNCTRN
jgi:hypothetical protein